MRYTLMHKQQPVAEIEIDPISGSILKIYNLFSPEHLPIGIAVRKGQPDRTAFNSWWIDRSIPFSRSGMEHVMTDLEIASPAVLAVRSMGFSLSDQYWIRPEGSDISWDSHNFFDHPFSEDVGAILFGQKTSDDSLDFSSPDSTSDGNLKKRWKIIDGKRMLTKGGSAPFRQQPFNEVIASEIMDRLHIPHIPYDVIFDEGAPYSICEDFVNRDTELVTAWRILQTQKKPNDVSYYQHFLQCAEALGIPGVVPFLNQMITLDYIIANEDRHLNNFGAIRDANTLQWIGMAPVYDSGSSLGYEQVVAEIRHNTPVPCKPFKKRHEDQLRLVSDYSWIAFDQLHDVHAMIEDTLSAGDDYIGQDRVQAIADAVDRRISNLQIIAENPSSSHTDGEDLTKNIARSYGDA